MDDYPTIYSDTRGCEATTIFNDGATLRISLRGVEFTGREFDSLEPSRASADHLQLFTLDHNCLCACRIACRIPIAVHDRGDLLTGLLLVEVILGGSAPNGGLDREELRIVLECDNQHWSSPRRTQYFEDELLGIQSQLPEGMYIKACINCLYSDYSPLGSGMFGSMMCFRNLKSEYLKVQSKLDFWSVHGRQDRFVQETYLCPEFERRIPGTGYRG